MKARRGRPGTSSSGGRSGLERRRRSASPRSRGYRRSRSTRSTSVAYGPEAIILVLAVAGAGALHLIAADHRSPSSLLLAVLVFSYRQVIDAYPGGGGAYAVSRANLGSGASLVAGALRSSSTTPSRSPCRSPPGVGSLTSAFPGLSGATVPICLGDPRRDHGVQPARPRGGGPGVPAPDDALHRRASRHHPHRAHPPARSATSRMPGQSLLPTRTLQAVSVLLVLKAFSAGCSALTGVEAIANGVPLFKEPRVKRAKRTELLLGVILGADAARPRGPRPPLADRSPLRPDRAQPDHGDGSRPPLRLLHRVADDHRGARPGRQHLVRWPAGAGEPARARQLPAAPLLHPRTTGRSSATESGRSRSSPEHCSIAVGGNTNAMIPLFAIGVFTGFTLAQTGLVVHWRRVSDQGLAVPGHDQRHRRRRRRRSRRSSSSSRSSPRGRG